MPDLKTILFPTDFSDESKEAFEQIVDFAADRKSKIILFHRVHSVAYPSYGGMAFSLYGYYEESIANSAAVSEQTAKQWAEQAKKRGVHLEVIIDRKQSGASVSDAILKQAKKWDAMIAMASHSGRVAAVFLGSATRQVIRHAERPVWILHPKTEHKRSKYEQAVRKLA